MSFLSFFGWVIVGRLLIFGRASLLVETGGSLLDLVQDLLSLDGGLVDLVLHHSLLVHELLCLPQLELLNGLLNFGHVSLGFLDHLFVLHLALLEPVVVLRENLFGLDGKLRFFDLARLLGFFDLLSILLGSLKMSVGDLSSLLLGGLKLGQDFGFLGDVLFVSQLSPLLSFRKLLVLLESKGVLLSKLLFSDLLSLLELHLELLQGWGS